ncbi:dienelactone hydrolase family protein [Pectobacteriaceae bacterium CE90]|nr:dienelactone hydrolase family protein [Prodigiosinella sp. LS101]WJV53970.1 dienelactone hydrolase family protein [Prodigiosinella sp. LS101]WJV58331.1 dienelactone hydrolase family protein [Pectobacteriaceae bacterium C111]WJY15033.1 dienelactone hydrolase family protein [Pectobacteriaceae bacterium CE90]
MKKLESYFKDKPYPVECRGASAESAAKFIILLHGRRQSSDDIYQIANRVSNDNIAWIIPLAPEKTWYPRGFLRDMNDNQPFADKAIHCIDEIINYLIHRNISSKNIWIVGFSQGACIGSQYLAHIRRSIGGALLFTGGLFGPKVDLSFIDNDELEKVPILLTGSNTDSWVPAYRVIESANYFRKLGANVRVEIFDQREHVVSEKEINIAREWLKSMPI